jgi:ribosome-associated protein
MPFEITPSLAIEDQLLEERFVRASGPGGQNVNKVATAVQLRFDLGQSSLPEEVKLRLRSLAGSRMTAEDVLVIDARSHRTQSQNRDEARERLAALVRQALIRPRTRSKTRPPRASKLARLDSKKRNARVKSGRRRVSGDD